MRTSRVSLAFGMLGWLFASQAFAQPRHVRVSWDDPDTARTAAVTWNSDSLADPSEVQYGPTAAYGATATGRAFQGAGGLGPIHEVSLTGLTPNTLYHYRVGGSAAWSADFTFRTGPVDGCTAYRFVALGDNRGDIGDNPSPYWNPILTEALAHEPAFLINTGDLVKDGESTEQWQGFLETTTPGWSQVPLLPSPGNHDNDDVAGDGARYNQLFTLPRNDVSGTEDYYYVLYGNAIFVSLSTVTHEGGAQPFGDQAAWLDRVLTEHPLPWKFVFFHHPPYSGVIGIPGLLDLNHPPDEKGQNAALLPIIDKHHVDFVFNGHNHFYQRFRPICDGVPVGDYNACTSYVITGGAGALTYDVPFVDLAGLLCMEDGSEACSGKHHYAVIDIDGLELHYRVYTTAAQLLGTDDDNVELIDEVLVSKAGTPPVCDEPPPPPVDPGPEVAEPAPTDTVSPPRGDTVGPPPDHVAAPETLPPVDAPAGPDTPATPDTPAPPDTPSVRPDVGPQTDPGGPTPGKDGQVARPDPGAPAPDGPTPGVDHGGGPAPQADVGAAPKSGGSGCRAAPGSASLVAVMAGLLLGLVRSRRRPARRLRG